MNSAATERRDEMRKSALWTAFRAITVSRPAKIAAIEKTQKKTASQPDRIIFDFRLPVADLRPFPIANCRLPIAFSVPIWRGRNPRRSHDCNQLVGLFQQWSD